MYAVLRMIYLFLVCQAVIVELQEQPLCPLVVVRETGEHFLHTVIRGGKDKGRLVYVSTLTDNKLKIATCIIIVTSYTCSVVSFPDKLCTQRLVWLNSATLTAYFSQQKTKG